MGILLPGFWALAKPDEKAVIGEVELRRFMSMRRASLPPESGTHKLGSERLTAPFFFYRSFCSQSREVPPCGTNERLITQHAKPYAHENLHQ